MTRVPSEYRIILIVIFLIAVPSAVLCYISLFALGREERLWEKKLKLSYEEAVDNVARRTAEALDEEEEALRGLAAQLEQRTYTLPTAWNLFSDAAGRGRLFRTVYLFDRNGEVVYPRLGPHRPEPGPAEAPDPAVLLELRDGLHRAMRTEFASSDPAGALEGYRAIADDALARAGRPGASLAAEALLGMARCYRRTGRHRRAAETLDTLVYRYPAETGAEGVPLAPGALLEKARLLRETGDKEGAEKTLADLALFLARNEETVPPRFLRFFRRRLAEEGGSRCAALYASHRERARRFRASVGAFAPLVRERVASFDPERPAGHLRAGERLAYAIALASRPQGPGPQGLVLLEADPAALEERFRAFARDAGLADRLVLVRPGNGRAPAPAEREVRASRSLPRPLPAWEIRYLGEREEGMNTLSTIRWSIYFWVILIASAVLVGGILFVIRKVSREMRLSRDRSDFLSNVTHDLKTPLTSIRMFIDTLRLGRVKEPGEVEECLGVMAGEADRLTRLIDRVLDFSKIERGTKRYDVRRVEVKEVIERTLAIFHKQMEEDAFELVDQYSVVLPAVRADPDAVIEVLLNLLDNALKYSPEEKRITLRAGASDGRVSVAVLDRGVGIAPKDLERIFDPFYRSDGSRGVEGTGLGLAHSQRVMQDLGGDILVESEPGRGSIFTLRLPVWKE